MKTLIILVGILFVPILVIAHNKPCTCEDDTTIKNTMNKITFILMAFIAMRITTRTQWSLQTNLLRSGSTAMTGKEVQFVSAALGWIACGSNGNILHRSNAGANLNIISPFPGNSVVNLSYPVTTLIWINSMNGWRLKTFMSRTNKKNGFEIY